MSTIVPSIVKSYNGKTIRIREDNYVCLTDMATANGKKINHWLELKSTTDYLTAFEQATGITVAVLLQVSNGNPTWGHPKIAIRFAQWCSPEFAIQVDFWVDELLTTGSVSITTATPQPLPRQLPPIRDTIEYLQASKEINLLTDPILKSYLLQSLYEDIGATKSLPASPEPQHVIVAVKARSMGFKLKVGQDSQLGKWIKKHLEPSGSTQHGKYVVNTYLDTVDLQEAIKSFFVYSSYQLN